MTGTQKRPLFSRAKMNVAALAAALTMAVVPNLAAAAVESPVARVAHSCSTGYKHAVTPGGHKCLRAGQYCSTKPGYQRVYKSKGYICSRGRLKYR
jgi:hypothetical protein